MAKCRTGNRPGCDRMILELSRDQAEALARRCGSPFYLFDPERFADNIRSFSAAMRSSYHPFILGYSYKTNYLPAACRLVQQMGGYAEVVSRLEYELALRLGYEQRNIIFNGPLKRDADLEIALGGGSIVNLDSLPEVAALCDWVRRNPRATPAAGLRINMKLVGSDGSSRVQEGLQAGRFGFAGEDLERAIGMLRTCGVEPVSLHGHASSSDRSVENFRTISRTLCAVRQRYALDELRYLNVGGGFFGPSAGRLLGRSVPAFRDYAVAIAEILLQDPWVARHRPALVAEPGVSVVADTMSLYTRVHSRKQIGAGKRFVTVDGSVFNVKPTMHPYNMPWRHIRADGERDGEESSYDVVGSTCMEKDVILSAVPLRDPQPGDWLEIKGCGAYTMVMTPPFINPAPAIVAPDGAGGFELLRTAQSVDQFLAAYRMGDDAA